MMNFSEHQYRSRDGLQLYYRSYGAGTDWLLCLPGLTRNCKDFERLAGRLSARWRVITPDLRGRGRSAWDPKPGHYNPAVYAGDVWTLLDELGSERVAVVGTSLGGLIAMIMADQQPQRLRGVILNDIGPEIPAAAIGRIMHYAGRNPGAPDWTAAAVEARRTHELSYPGMADDFWLDYVRRSYRENSQGRPEPDMDPAIGEVLRRPPAMFKAVRWLHRRGLLRRLGGASIDPWDSYRAMTMPGLLLHGAISDVLTTDIVERMQAAKPDLEVVTVPDRGHVPLLDEPVAIAAIERFLLRILSA